MDKTDHLSIVDGLFREEALKATPRQNVFDPANFINIGIILRVFLEASQGL